MVLNPIFLGAVWFIIHRYSVFHTFIWRGWVGGLSQMGCKVYLINFIDKIIFNTTSKEKSQWFYLS
jgi:hypothetical protein